MRLLRRAGRRVEVQNYIDNTGVQVADVVVGFQHIEKKSLDEVRALAAAPRFDYLCWDLYARVTQFFEEDKTRLALRGADAGGHRRGPRRRRRNWPRSFPWRSRAATCAPWSGSGVEYDVLPRESEILHLKFWDAAFEQLKQRGAIHLATTGKNCGLLGDESRRQRRRHRAAPASEADDDAKVIVRSNGTVTYVGKDIAYQLWKFGLLGRDFAYRRFYTYPNGHTAWTSAASDGDPAAPVVWPRVRSLQRDRHAPGLSAKRRGGGTARAGIRRSRPTARSIFRTRWWRSRRAAPRRWATRSRRKRRASLTWKSAGAKDWA